MAGLPLHLYRYTDTSGKEKAIDHPLYVLLHDEPNPEMTSFVFRETLMTHLLLWGNAETRKFQINEIARIFRVPPHMVGDLEKSSFSNIEQQSLEFVKYTLEPWLVRWEQSMIRALVSNSEKAAYFIKFNVDGLLRGDYQSRMNGYAIGRQNGWMSANDIRELENLDRIAGLTMMSLRSCSKTS